ncbi:MAG: prepilin-type N-terminal cleavage/methylation domain-containing protein [bacterium]|nr:prepilin-type N-terminal cleavage/methylation domain-containing protein [bacterium]
MKNIQKAFTLAEALIAIAIIGVVAAITIPNLVRDNQKKIAAATLGKAIEQVQNGCQNMIQFDNEAADGPSHNDKIAYVNNGDFLAENKGIGGYIGAKIQSGTQKTLKKYANDGDANLEVWKNSTKRYRFSKLNAEIGFLKNNNLKDAEEEKLDSKVADVYINVNPNAGTGSYEPKLGKDVFLYEMQNSCRLIPVGIDNPDACPGDGGTNCAARIVKDGYKITY